MSVTERRTYGGRDLSVEALEMVERQPVPMLGIAAPSGCDFKLFIFPTTALKLPCEIRQGAKKSRVQHSETRVRPRDAQSQDIAHAPEPPGRIRYARDNDHAQGKRASE